MEGNDEVDDVRWWAILAVVTVVNVIVALRYYRMECCSSSAHRTITILCIVYVIVCCVRAVFPVRIIERTCFKSSLISPFVDRCAATVAEMSFILLIAIATTYAMRYSGQRREWQQVAIGTTVLLIALAQTCCWLGCTTTNQLWNASEESLWAISFTILIAVWSRMYLDAKQVPHLPLSRYLRQTLPIMVGLAVLYVLYMVTTDVPMYVRRWREHDISPRSLSEGVRDMMKCQNITSDHRKWQDDSLWRIGYFSGAVWAAMGMVVWYHRMENTMRISRSI